MANIDVFEMAFSQNQQLSEIADQKKSIIQKVNKALTESKISTLEKCKNAKKKIAINKIKFTEDIDDIDIQPAEGVVVVYSDEIKPEMSQDEVEKAAEEMIGAKICKCGICGANYVVDDEHSCEDEQIVVSDDEIVSESFVFTEEDIHVDADESENIECDTVCPVCNSDEAQVEVGVIAPAEEADVEEVDTEEHEEVSTEDTHEETTDDEQGSEEVEETEETEEVEDAERVDDVEDDEVTDETEVDENVKSKSNYREITFKEAAFNRLLKKFVSENFNNVKDVKIIKGKATPTNQFKLFGYAITENNKKRPFTFESVGFKYKDGDLKIKMREHGPFTESAVNDKSRVPFVLECKAHYNTILPVALKYSYKIKNERGLYECVGRHSLGV